jgi:hypothetical protein
MFGRKVGDHQLDGEHVLSCTVLRMLAVGCRVLFCSSNDLMTFWTHLILLINLGQDDDYLILPEVIQALHARITELDRPSAVHLLPPHGRLSSDLWTVHARDSNRALHTAFSWLGHGAIMHNSLASEFLSLLQILNVRRKK